MPADDLTAMTTSELQDRLAILALELKKRFNGVNRIDRLKCERATIRAEMERRSQESRCVHLREGC